MTTFPAAPIDINKIIDEFERKLGVPFDRDKHGVGISNANKNLLDWKYSLEQHLIHCYKAANTDYAEEIKEILVKKGAFPLPNDIIIDDVYKEKPLFVFLRSLRKEESSQEEYES